MPKKKKPIDVVPAAVAEDATPEAADAVSAKKEDEIIKKIARMDAKGIKDLVANTKALAGITNVKDRLTVADAAQKRWRRFSRSPLPVPEPKREGRWFNRTSRDASVVACNNGRLIKVDQRLATTAIDSIYELRGTSKLRRAA